MNGLLLGFLLMSPRLDVITCNGVNELHQLDISVVYNIGEHSDYRFFVTPLDGSSPFTRIDYQGPALENGQAEDTLKDPSPLHYLQFSIKGWDAQISYQIGSTDPVRTLPLRCFDN